MKPQVEQGITQPRPDVPEDWPGSGSAPDAAVPGVSFVPAGMPVGRRSRIVRAVMPFTPALALGVMWLFWLGADGAYYPQSWYPSALVALATLAVTICVGGRTLPRHGAARAAVLAFAGLVAVGYLSILWARSPANALDSANQMLLYLTVAWTFALLPWSARSLAVLLGGVSVSVAAFCAVGLVRAHGATSLDSFFVDLRYSRPMAYPNATAALAVFGLWPALMLSARPSGPRWLRAVLLGVAAFLTGFALLPQSRGALLGMAVVAPLLLATAGCRVRLALRMAVAGLAAAYVAPRTVAVDRAVSAGHRVEPVLARASLAMLVAALAAALVGWGLILLEGRIERTTMARRMRGIARAPRFRWGAALALVAALAIGLVVAASPLAHLTHTVISSGRNDAATGSTRILSSSPEERFDYDRVALQLFRAHPLLGIGAGNFGIFYDAAKRFPKHSLYVHDLPLRILSETGLVGALLFVVLLLSLMVGLWRTGRSSPEVRAGCAATFALAAYFLLHGSLDWLEQFPALAAPAIALPLAAMGQRLPPPAGMMQRRQPVAGSRGGLPRPLQALAGAIALVTCAMLVGGPYLAQRYVNRASSVSVRAPEKAYQDLHEAHQLNPLSAAPYAAAGLIALQLGESTYARSQFNEAVAQDGDWFSRVEVALIDAAAGRRAVALREMSAAAQLDRMDPALAVIDARIRSGHSPAPATLDQLLVANTPASIFKEQTVR